MSEVRRCPRCRIEPIIRAVSELHFVVICPMCGLRTQIHGRSRVIRDWNKGKFFKRF